MRIDSKKITYREKKGTLLIFRRQSKIMSMYLYNDRPERITVSDDSGLSVGDIFVGRILQRASNIDAVFVSMPNKEKGFLPLKKDEKVFVTQKGEKSIAKTGDDILVQVDALSAKGKKTKLTSSISVCGKFCVCCLGKGAISASNKVNEEVKNKLIDTFKCEMNTQILRKRSYIIRTNAGELLPDNESELIKEAESLSIKIDDVFAASMHKECGKVIYKAECEYISELKSIRISELNRIVTDDEEIFQSLYEYMSQNTAADKTDLKLYVDEAVPLKVLFGIEQKLSNTLNRKVWLKSGGSLYIDTTEAMTVIDVNTGKYDKKTESESTYLKINLEAAEEIAYRLRLLNISGIIIVDFINMNNAENYDILLDKLSKYIASDSNHTKIVDVTKLGLVEITRKKTGKSLREQILV